MDPDMPAPVPRSLRGADSSEQRRALAAVAVRIVVFTVGLIGGYFVLPFDRASTAETGVMVALVLVLLAGVNLFQLRAVANAELPWLRAAEALVVSVVLLLVAFAAIYVSMSGRDDAAFSEPLDHLDSLYFTLTTLTTIGFGDIAPVSTAARTVVMIQMVVNVIILGVFVKIVTSTVRARLADPGA